MGNLNYTLISDAVEANRLKFSDFCQPVVKALARMGVMAEISGRNDMTIDGKKFSGNAQYVKQHRIMHHGTILFDSDLSVVSAALNVSKDKIESKGIKSVRSRVTNVREYLPKDMPLEEFKNLLKHYMVDEQHVPQYFLTPEDVAAVKELQKTYESWEWNYGSSPKYSIRKERRIEGFGKIQIMMDVDKGGIITNFATFGDYFGADADDVAKAIIGHAAEEKALLTALADLDIGLYFNNLTREQLIEVILQ